MPKNAIAANDLARELVAAHIISATLSAPRGAHAEQSINKIRVRRVADSGDAAFQIEEFRGPQAFHRNVGARELEAELAAALGAVFSRAEFRTETETVSVMANRRGALSAIKKPRDRAPSAGKLTAGTGANSARTPLAAATSHNRVKNYILAEGVPVPFLVDLGVMTAEGAVVKASHDKFRQINRFLEFIADVVPELERAQEEHPDRDLTIVDFGCGKSYLTFAVYHYLVSIRGMRARIVGLDLKKDVIAHCADLAARYGYEKLSFAVGDIADYAGADEADMVITLHACDTATDFALAQAVRWNSRVILSVPCCQHELNAQLAGNGTANASGKESGPGRNILDAAFRHGIVRERMAALLTDAMRAELLETEGYGVQILEFIDMSHTPKNLLIRAVRRGDRAKGSEKTARIDACGKARALY